jgi:hypothetical protein
METNLNQLLFKLFCNIVAFDVFLNFNTSLVPSMVCNTVPKLSLSMDFPLSLKPRCTLIFEKSGLKAESPQNIPSELFLNH